jgi:hypothetical protein
MIKEHTCIMRENEFKIDLLAKLTEDEQIFRDDRPEILLISITTEEQNLCCLIKPENFSDKEI